MAKITYTNKATMNENASIPAINKCQATDMNSIKNAVNENGSFTPCSYTNSKYSCTLEGTLSSGDIVCVNVPLSSQGTTDSEIQISVDGGTTYNYIKDSTGTFNIKASYLNFKDTDLILKYNGSGYVIVAPDIEKGSSVTFMRTTNQSVSTGSFSKINYDLTTANGISIASISSGTITINQTGIYLIALNTIYDTNTTGGRYQDVFRGAAGYAIASTNGATGVRTALNSSLIAEFTAGDTFYCRAYQTSGGNLNIILGSSVSLTKIK